MDNYLGNASLGSSTTHVAGTLQIEELVRIYKELVATELSMLDTVFKAFKVDRKTHKLVLHSVYEEGLGEEIKRIGNKYDSLGFSPYLPPGTIYAVKRTEDEDSPIE